MRYHHHINRTTTVRATNDYIPSYQMKGNAKHDLKMKRKYLVNPILSRRNNIQHGNCLINGRKKRKKKIILGENERSEMKDHKPGGSV